MLSKALIKYINSLQIKKYRLIHQAFLVEGAKSVRELLHSDFAIEKLFITEAFYQSNTKILHKGYAYEIITEEDLVKAGTYASNNAALAIAKIKKPAPFNPSENPFTIALDDIRDPGNLGTISRVADWYGIKNIICSHTCADFYNPKVIAATMGSFCRVSATYVNLPEFLNQYSSQFNIYGAALNGQNIHRLQLLPEGILVMGNEANGLSPAVADKVKSLIKIPGFGQAESLNVATATAILVDNFYRNVGE
ncbi:RNA methyltransferase [Adhaeribacter aerolatus]|uniref:RNA methyltransferase n=1 Tax=Adhaeribacter aerolatus TaxID=670289 RepID=A0A512B489_9BACT|nr:RNA methyltransferase [Adhaeribacter aerolatus]GEO06785.1 RNA methyltransferase [Adhaeribacter aerolatus]